MWALLLNIAASILSAILLWVVATSASLSPVHQAILYLGIAWFGVLCVSTWYAHSAWHLRAIGIESIRRGRRRYEFNHYASAMGSRSFWFWGISGRRIVAEPEIVRRMVAICQGGGEVRILLLHPQCEALERRAREENDRSDAWRKDIYATIARIRALNQQNGIAMEVRVCKELPIWRLLFHDDQRVWVTWFHGTRQGAKTPQVVLTAVHDDSLYWPLRRRFIEVWERRSQAVLPLVAAGVAASQAANGAPAGGGSGQVKQAPGR